MWGSRRDGRFSSEEPLELSLQVLQLADALIDLRHVLAREFANPACARALHDIAKLTAPSSSTVPARWEWSWRTSATALPIGKKQG